MKATRSSPPKKSTVFYDVFRLRVSVRGVVQGVGFRPFVYQLASKHNLKGWVCNTSGDVKIDVEGEKVASEQFLADLETLAPPELVLRASRLPVSQLSATTALRSEKAPPKRENISLFPRILPPAPLVSRNSCHQMTGATFTLSLTAPTVAPALP